MRLFLIPMIALLLTGCARTPYYTEVRVDDRPPTPPSITIPSLPSFEGLPDCIAPLIEAAVKKEKTQ